MLSLYRTHIACRIPPIDCQPQEAGNFLSSLDSDSVSALVALLAFLLSIFTFIDQKRKDRKNNADQNQKDRQNAIDTEKLRQQTIRLEWYRDATKLQLASIQQTFHELMQLRASFTTADLSDSEKDRILAEYKKKIFGIRDQNLESILYVHGPTYSKLKAELDRLADDLTLVIVNDELKLSNGSVYDREIGDKIKDCQQRFFNIIYSYRGEE